MSSEPVVLVAAPWRLHADAVVAALVDHGLPAGRVVDPVPVQGVVVAGALLPDLESVLEQRREAGRQTIVWGGTLPPPRVAALRRSGAAAYVSMLRPPADLVAVVEQVIDGQVVQHAEGGGPAPALTPREGAVARAYLVDLADRTRAEVAQQLGVSERTLKVHIANIRAKSGQEGTHTREGLRRTLIVRGWL